MQPAEDMQQAEFQSGVQTRPVPNEGPGSLGYAIRELTTAAHLSEGPMIEEVRQLVMTNLDELAGYGVFPLPDRTEIDGEMSTHHFGDLDLAELIEDAITKAQTAKSEKVGNDVDSTPESM